MSKLDKNNSNNGNGRKRKNTPRSDSLHEGEMIIRRFMLNQPNSRMGLEPGAFRNTFSGQEYESLVLDCGHGSHCSLGALVVVAPHIGPMGDHNIIGLRYRDRHIGLEGRDRRLMRRFQVPGKYAG